jgi:hypothetical protein
MAVSNAAVQVGTMAWSDLYPMSPNLSRATSAPQTGAQASGGQGISTSTGIGATHWLIGGIIGLVVFRFFYERQTLRA